jgi:hypothetical protein
MIARNIWFDLTDDEPALTIAPCRTIELTPEVLAADAAKQAARIPKITWKPRLSDPTHAHKPSRTPRQPAKQDRRRPCKGCKIGMVSRNNETGLCRTCKAKENPGYRGRSSRREREVLRDKERISAGLCTRCGETNDTKRTRCNSCITKQNVINQKCYDRKKAER